MVRRVLCVHDPRRQAWSGVVRARPSIATVRQRREGKNKADEKGVKSQDDIRSLAGNVVFNREWTQITRMKSGMDLILC